MLKIDLFSLSKNNEISIKLDVQYEFFVFYRSVSSTTKKEQQTLEKNIDFMTIK